MTKKRNADVRNALQPVQELLDRLDSSFQEAAELLADARAGLRQALVLLADAERERET